ncbi:MAG: ada, AraC family transcriptional regulator, regulatory protein of adaptative response [Acidobacteria bacterium]|nr:ada, AraC family transcriptional regulator, regulatory protein of adaptative response [Acidobacteriota bacterium]
MNLALAKQMNSAPAPQDYERLWEAVITKDARHDGKFVFAVSSTGIYCRPSCPSRRPRRDRVSFFALPEAAERAGFRACLRCHPSEANAADAKVALVRRACDLINQADENLKLSDLSAQLGISSFHLQRTFKKITGISPRQYADSCRAEKFKGSIREGQPITSALYDAGYSSSSRLYERSTAELGMTPATYSRNGRGAVIDYAVASCDLGFLLVAATAKGICAVRLGSSEIDLENDLRGEFSAASVKRDDAQLRGWVDQILEHLAGRRPDLNLPLDVQATAFQRLVWEALQAIPYGSTRSYSEVAEAIGRPTAVRAVARACATNPVALVVPCHRVIGSNKRLSGYRWGLERKERLLEQERSNSEG